MSHATLFTVTRDTIYTAYFIRSSIVIQNTLEFPKLLWYNESRPSIVDL
jgi:hypothetical protein